MTQHDGEWTRLPGLFRWSEVCDALYLGAGPDGEWRFLAEPGAVSVELEPLYVVHAAHCPSRP